MTRRENTLLMGTPDVLEQKTALLAREELDAFVDSFVRRREVFLQARREHGSPLYVLEEDVLLHRAERFCVAFGDVLPDVCVYYAVKSNNCPHVAARLLRAGLGLDVSSGRELEMALDCGATDVVFSGPGKQDDELLLAVSHRDRVTVLIDSFGELERLERVASGAGTTMRAGVRLTTDETGLWRKFGIPLSDLPRFIASARECRHVMLRGLQFHTSWNMGPGNQVGFIARLGAALASLDAAQRSWVEFVDIAGGFWPPQGEWLHPSCTPGGNPSLASFPPPSNSRDGHYKVPSTPIEEFARRIGEAVRTHLFPQIACCVCAEPGRWLCNDAMHILLTVVDKKADDMVITDAGTNAVGGERFEVDYFPLINLSRPALIERDCYVLGSLCTPHDVWGYSYYGVDIQRGDVLLIPTQGAYTYSLRQHFIKPLPDVALLSSREGPSAGP